MSTHPHPVDDLINGRYASYQIKFEGVYRVGEASGPSPVQSAFIDMKRAKDERRKKGQKKAPIMEIQICVDGVTIINPETNTTEVKTPLGKISFIMNDRNNKLYAAFIYKIMPSSEQTSTTTNNSDVSIERTSSFTRSESDACLGYECVIVKHDGGKAKEIVMTLAEAFDIAFQKKIDGRTATSNESGSASDTLKSNGSESGSISVNGSSVNEQDFIQENIALRDRLVAVAKLIPKDSLDQFLKTNGIERITDIKKKTPQPAAVEIEPSDPLDHLYSELLKPGKGIDAKPTTAFNRNSPPDSRPKAASFNPFLSMNEPAPALPEDLFQDMYVNPMGPSVPSPPQRISINPPPDQKKGRITSRPVPALPTNTVDVFGMDSFSNTFPSSSSNENINKTNPFNGGNLISYTEKPRTTTHDAHLDMFDPLKKS